MKSILLSHCRRQWTILLLYLMILACSPARAGGWSVVTVEQAPQHMLVNTARQVRFTVRAHGRSLTKANMTIRARHSASGESLRFTATVLERGRYLAELSFPQAGIWRWQVDGYGEHPMPNIDVTTSHPVAGSEDPAALGERLFVSKGCVRCHLNQRVENHGLSMNIGPDLSEYSADGTFLRKLLDDPGALRSDARMPDLELTRADINALVAFINREL